MVLPSGHYIQFCSLTDRKGNILHPYQKNQGNSHSCVLNVHTSNVKGGGTYTVSNLTRNLLVESILTI
jgi:hypothetical protein